MPVRYGDVQDLGFDYSVIAHQLSAAKKLNRKKDKEDAKKGKNKRKHKREKPELPDVASLTTAVSSIELEDTIEGSSTLTVTVVDPEYEFVEFVDIDDDGRLEGVDMEFPEDSGNWWRLTQLGIADDIGTPMMRLVFMERPTVWLQHHYGPIKRNRANVTRAEFFKQLCDRVKIGRGIRFVSHELHDIQPIVGSLGTPGGPKQKDDDDAGEPLSDEERRNNKDRGIPKDAVKGLTIAGGQASWEQIKQVNRALDTAARVGTTERIVEAMVCAGIGESGFSAIMNKEGSPYGGVFQGDVAGGVWDINDTEGMAKCFIKGGKGFQPPPSGGKHGGAEYWANNHEDWGPGLIAVSVEGSRANFSSDQEAEHHYGQWQDEANELMTAYGGGFTGGTSYYKQDFFFQIGDEEEPHEDFWTGMNRLADDVNWRLFCDGRTIYFDDEMRLIQQVPAATIYRGSPVVISYDALWDARKLCTEMRIDLICDPFEFRAGDVFLLREFGPLSQGSTAKPKPLPGRWLVTGITRSSASMSSTFTLRQPAKPRREPANTVAARESLNEEFGGNVKDITGGSTPKEIIDHMVIPLAKKHKMTWGETVKKVEAANAAHGPTISGSRSDHQGPPNDAWAADMGDGGTAGSPKMDALAKELVRVFDVPQLASYTARSGETSGNLVSATHKGRRFQLIYRTTAGGDHYDHVHFGIRDERSAAERKRAANEEKRDQSLSQDELNNKYGWGQ